MADQQQSFANHARYDPPFHFFILPVAVATFIMTVVHFVRFPSFPSGWLVVVAAAAIVAVFDIRMYALRVQDRVIRLEERLRLASVLQEPLRSRIGELADTQLIGLRFACDAELPALVQRCLAEKLGRKDIKAAVVNWRPDITRI
jgi:hypothetical protein